MPTDDVGRGRSRVVLPSAQAMYAAAARWRDESLIGDRSLFDGRPLDGRAAAQDLVEFFVDRPDEGTGSFISKLRTQLEPAGPDAVQMAAELLYVHFLIASTEAIRAETKRAQIQAVISFRQAATTPLPEGLAGALAGGVANPGQAFNSLRWKMFGYLVLVVRAVKELSTAGREKALGSFEVFQDFLSDIDDQSVWSQRYALEHLLFPDTAPAILSRDDRRTIVAAFGVESPGDVRNLVTGLEPNVSYGWATSVNLYRTPYRERWAPPSELHKTYAGWAAKVIDVDGLLDGVRLGKDKAAEKLRSAFGATDPLPILRTGLKGELVDFRAADDFLRWVEGSPYVARLALRELAQDSGPEAIDRFLDLVPVDDVPGLGTRLSVASALSMSWNPELPPWRETLATITARLIGGYKAQAAATPGEHYALFLEQIDVIRSLVADHVHIDLDRLDAHSLAWILAKHQAVPGWSAAENTAFAAWQSGKQPAGSQEAAADPDPPSAETVADVGQGTVENLADRLYMDGTEWLSETLALLRAKKQLILQGPPGTGKTYIARALAEFVAGDSTRAHVVQFHPGTSYEDFVQGLRPAPDGVPGTFAVVDGPLVRIADAARDDPEHDHVIVVDELNRGNIAAVFGELYYLLEYRDRPITLTYGRHFQLPPNLYVIGTMNTADRSITVLDSALRRRFYVRDLRPGERPLDAVLRRYLQEKAAEMLWLADLLDRANDIITDRDQAIGPSHFMLAEPDEAWARRAWDHTVMPTLREVFFGRENVLQQLEFTALKGLLSGVVSDDAAD